MPIISKIGRKHPKVRLLVAVIYLVLGLGAVTMVYPFLIMVSGSTKSGVDIRDFDIFPRFLANDSILYRKHIEGLFNESLSAMRETYHSDEPSFTHVSPPTNIHRAFVDEWLKFIGTTDLSVHAFGCGYTDAPVSKTIPRGQREFKNAVSDKYDGDIHNVNAALNTHFSSWNWFFDASAGNRALVLSSDFLPRYIRPSDSSFAKEFEEFKFNQPIGNRYYFSVEGFYRHRYLKNRYTHDISKYNAAQETSFASYRDVHLPRQQSDRKSEIGNRKSAWEIFVRNTLNLLWIRVTADAAPQYRRFLEAKHGSLTAINKHYGTAYVSFENIPLIDAPPLSGLALSDWEMFISGWKDPDTGKMHAAPLSTLRVHSVDFMFRDYLRKTYPDITGLNQALGTAFKEYMDVLPPQKEAHYIAFLENRGGLRREFATRNYRTVMDYMVFHGRGIWNTAIYCALAVLFALIVNPLAAYAMSRYRMPSTYKVLLFLMLTMAFPPMVTQIPVFIMLRELGLLNTFAALLLPGLANGYAIFLLKGFFDSLPNELYESAQMDGAGEWTMFWRITMSLSKPILAVIALQAFTIAYSNFMFALLICQDNKMWTLMVWLYQLQQRSGQAVMYASLIIAAAPTFLIFAFCQKIIIRGIVVPVEK